jgi:hypothetical protein
LETRKEIAGSGYAWLTEIHCCHIWWQHREFVNGQRSDSSEIGVCNKRFDKELWYGQQEFSPQRKTTWNIL